MSRQEEESRLVGFLNIEEAEFSGNFYRRYFVLDIANKKLAYYMDNPENLPESWKNPVGEIYIQYINKVYDAKDMRPRVPWCFVVNVAGRQYFLQAEDGKSMTVWIDALNRAGKISVSASEHAGRGKEWRAVDPSHEGYVAEIAGGVVCKMPMQTGEDSNSGSDSEELHPPMASTTTSVSSTTGSLSRIFNMHGNDHRSRDSLKSEGFAKATALKTGYAVKQGAVRKNWKRRFFTLHTKGLSYAKSEQDKEPLRTIALTDIVDARPADGANVSRDNLFEVVTNKRTFYVQCDSPTERQSWIDEIRAVLPGRKHIKEPEQGSKRKSEVREERIKSTSHSVWV